MPSISGAPCRPTPLRARGSAPLWAVAFALPVLAAVVVHNSRIAGRPTGVATNGGVNFFLGHCECRAVTFRSEAFELTRSADTQNRRRYTGVVRHRAGAPTTSPTIYRETLRRIAERPGAGRPRARRAWATGSGSPASGSGRSSPTIPAGWATKTRCGRCRRPNVAGDRAGVRPRGLALCPAAAPRGDRGRARPPVRAPGLDAGHALPVPGPSVGCACPSIRC